MKVVFYCGHLGHFVSLFLAFICSVQNHRRPSKSTVLVQLPCFKKGPAIHSYDINFSFSIPQSEGSLLELFLELFLCC